MREKILFNEGWAFHDGDVAKRIPPKKGVLYLQAKTERSVYGPASRFYIENINDYSSEHEVGCDNWITVDLPHDYIITQAPNQSNADALGYFDYHNAWYRKRFTLSEEDRNKRITLFFEGIATHAVIYLNGCLIKRNFCGYTSFEADITDFAEFGKENILSVYVDTAEHEGWWYEGGGIYRNVWLVKTDRASVDLWGLYVKTCRNGDAWAVNIENTIRNDYNEPKKLGIKTVIKSGESDLLELSGELEIKEKSKAEIKLSGNVFSPRLWSLENPYQHKAVTYVYLDGAEVDSYETKFGFREFKCDINEGLLLNGKKVYINGVCSHQDFGLTGKAVSDNIARYKVKLIKEMGANGFRCSHYPHSEATMDALDEFGFITMNETRWFDSSEEGLEQLEMLVKRDRNRPSVAFWSTGNEEPFHKTDVGKRITQTMNAKIKSLDDTRLITSAVSYNPEIATVYDDVDIIGINYHLGEYETVHSQYPDKLIFASECCATGTTRGWYYDDCPEKAYLNAIDKDADSWFLGREKTWKFLKSKPWVVGGYQWIAFEHRGECSWPRLCSQSGAIDLFLQKKDAFYQNQSFWIEDRPMIHLLPHWNFKGYEGERITVVAYTNCEEAELFLNGRSLGKKSVERYGRGQWEVCYEAGELSVLGYNSGVSVTEDKQVTTGEPVKLMLRLENDISKANGQDIALFTCYCIDKNGAEVPTAAPFVRFAVNKLGKIIGTGSDICDHIPVTETDRQMRAGRISVAVKVGKNAGDLKLYAESEYLENAVVSVELI